MNNYKSYIEILKLADSSLNNHQLEHLITELEDLLEAREDAADAEEDDVDARQMSIEEAEAREQAAKDLFDLEEGNGLDDLDNQNQ